MNLKRAQSFIKNYVGLIVYLYFVTKCQNERLLMYFIYLTILFFSYELDGTYFLGSYSSLEYFGLHHIHIRVIWSRKI